jgi:hypothetical protein
MFSQNHFKNQNTGNNNSLSPSTPLSATTGNTKKGLETKKKEEFVTEQSFTKNFTTIFIGDLD